MKKTKGSGSFAARTQGFLNRLNRDLIVLGQHLDILTTIEARLDVDDRNRGSLERRAAECPSWVDDDRAGRLWTVERKQTHGTPVVKDNPLEVPIEDLTYRHLAIMADVEEFA